MRCEQSAQHADRIDNHKPENHCQNGASFLIAHYSFQQSNHNICCNDLENKRDHHIQNVHCQSEKVIAVEQNIFQTAFCDRSIKHGQQSNNRSPISLQCQKDIHCDQQGKQNCDPQQCQQCHEQLCSNDLGSTPRCGKEQITRLFGNVVVEHDNSIEQDCHCPECQTEHATDDSQKQWCFKLEAPANQIQQFYQKRYADNPQKNHTGTAEFIF